MGLRVSLGMALIALIIVAIAENGRIPVDNPATHLELTMVHEAMVLEYSGRHLALIELASALKLLLYTSLIACVFAPWGLAPAGAPFHVHLHRRRRPMSASSPSPASCSPSSKLDRQDACLPRAGLSRRGADARVARRAPAVRRRGASRMDQFAFDVAHLLAGSLVLVSLMLLYQDRLYALLNVFALQAVVLALSVSWQAWVQDAPHLYLTAAIALIVKAIIIPVALHRMIRILGIHREVETALNTGYHHAGRPGVWWRCRWPSSCASPPRPTCLHARIWRSLCRSCCSGC